jgi:Tfp pilus assembly protein PilX
MSFLPLKRLVPRENRRGVALVLVLAFVVLLASIIVAFFSRALAEQQISSSSANQTKVKLLADGAVDTIVGDLKAEIADPANSVDVTDQLSAAPTDGSRVYLPVRAQPTDPATTMVPKLQGVTHSTDPLAPNGLENLVKISTGGRASGLASTDAAQSRPITPAKWNQPRFLQGTDATDATPTAAFPAPHWINISTDAMDPNPKTPNSQIIGRYAYAIYDEGGLLDINAAGFPKTGGPEEAMGAYRTNMGFVDLTKLKGGSDSAYPNTALFNDAEASAIVGWRNYASAQANGSGVTHYTFSSGGGTATKPSPYFKAMASNPKGFLQTINSDIAGGASDHVFVSRQQLIDFLKALGEQTGNTDQLLSSLQYLTTFSRALERPSFSFPGSLTGVGLPPAPAPYAFGSGGNDQVANFTTINSSFVRARAAGSFPRIDGSMAAAGEPLLKKRFPLSRLAWLTYDGPSSGRTSDTGDANADIKRLKELGVTSEYLAQGTPTNIQNAFGLTWNNTTKRWTYMASLLNGGHIRALSEITGREPNFFELLKATINVGSLAKPAGDPALKSASGGGMTDKTFKDEVLVFGNKPFYFEQSKIDASVDLAILQLGANIIDQADADGWPTQIEIPTGAKFFPSSSGPAEDLPKDNAKSDQYAISYRYPSNSSTGVPTISDPYVITGVENLPYISRVRWVAIRVKDPVNDGGKPPSTPSTVSETGALACMLWPEIWNPHGYDAASSHALGVPRPSIFTLTARDAMNVSGGAETVSGNQYSSSSKNTSTTSWFASGAFEHGQIETHCLTENNTQLTFKIPDGKTGYELFREPTLLNQVGLPTGSDLKDPIKPYGKLASIPGAVTGNGIQASARSSLYQGRDFIGIYLGGGPAQWKDDRGFEAADKFQFDTQAGNGAKGFPAWVFTLKASDGGGREVRYDIKRVVNNQETALAFPDSFSGRNGATLDPEVVYSAGSLFNGIPNTATVYFMTIDPRTSRWNFLDILTNQPDPKSAIAPSYPPTSEGGGWGTPAGTVLTTYRPGTTDGTVIISRTYSEWNSPDYIQQYRNVSNPGVIFKTTDGWQTGPAGPPKGPKSIKIGYLSENKWTSPMHYADADKIIRRASGGYSSGTTGLPLAKPPGATTPSDSRPIILNRPFRSVAELGVVFSGTPWKNLSFAFPESGDSALLDVFCVNEVSDPSGMVAGKFDLNTRQLPVVKAVLEGAYQNELAAGGNFSATSDTVSTTAADTLAQMLVRRTNSPVTNQGPFTNVSNLLGYYIGGGSAAKGYQDAFQGFGKDISDLMDGTSSFSKPSNVKWEIPRYTESAIRALSNTGQTRVWNLMIDVVAQTGKYASGATDLAKFAVDGEKRYWVHLAVDRFTGKVLDKQVEVVRE